MTDNELGSLYDPQALQKDAKTMLTKANKIVLVHLAMGLFFGYIAYGLLPDASVLLRLFVAAMVILTAYHIADAKALTLRLLAQHSLCSVRIEENTRPPSTS